MKKLIVGSLLLVTVSAFADQEASWTCTGPVTTLTGHTTYLGESATKFSQTLYTVITKEYGRTAFFLVSSQKTTEDEIIITGSNGKGGKFELKLNNIANTSDEENWSKSALGILSYSHGPMAEDHEKMTCIFE